MTIKKHEIPGRITVVVYRSRLHVFDEWQWANALSALYGPFQIRNMNAIILHKRLIKHWPSAKSPSI